MNTRLIFAAILVARATLAPAQVLQEPNAVFQYFSTEAMPAMPLMVQKPVTGRPMAATEIRHTLQVLADGTRIERRDNSKYYRDSEGRTRTESADGTRVTIANPGDGSTVEMNTSQHSAHRSGMVRTFNVKSEAAGVVEVKDKLVAEALARTQTAGTPRELTIIRRDDSASHTKDAKTENLGIQNVNGVLAEGTRTTITIPVGEIGNDRPINIVNEKWFSEGIGMLVKSVNSDPRFGETTYELTDIREGVQDQSLFQVPADYSQGNARRDW